MKTVEEILNEEGYTKEEECEGYILKYYELFQLIEYVMEKINTNEEQEQEEKS